MAQQAGRRRAAHVGHDQVGHRVGAGAGHLARSPVVRGARRRLAPTLLAGCSPPARDVLSPGHAAPCVAAARAARYFLRPKSTVTTFDAVVALGQRPARRPVPADRSRPPRAARARVGAERLELQPEIDRRIDERGDRARTGSRSLAGIWLKLSPTEKPVVADLQVPELVLQHDRHLVGEALAQVRRDRSRPARRS